jgi:hypothetical protein
MKGLLLIISPLLPSTRLALAHVTACFILSVAADARIVALGASDVGGWFGVLHHQTWPAQLEGMLKANEAQIARYHHNSRECWRRSAEPRA